MAPTQTVKYIAVPQELWNRLWSATPTAERRLDLESPLAKLGWRSFWSLKHEAFILISKDDGDPHPNMVQEARERGVVLQFGGIEDPGQPPVCPTCGRSA